MAPPRMRKNVSVPFKVSFKSVGVLLGTDAWLQEKITALAGEGLLSKAHPCLVTWRRRPPPSSWQIVRQQPQVVVMAGRELDYCGDDVPSGVALRSPAQARS